MNSQACTLLAFNLASCVHDTLFGWLDPLWTYVVWGFWIAVALLVLGVLARIKEVFGWPGVVAAFGAIGAAFGFILRGKIDAERAATGAVQFPGGRAVPVQKPSAIRPRSAPVPPVIPQLPFNPFDPRNWQAPSR
jgi:peptidoglycan/LPS O-acetylase OafA/YrhL